MDFNNKPAPTKHHKKHHKSKLTIQFNPSALQNYVTGFHTRKLERQRYGALEHAKKQRELKIELKKQKKHAFEKELGTSIDDISDNDTTDNNTIHTHDTPSQQHNIPEPINNEWKYEDDNAIVTVVTHTNDSDNEQSTHQHTSHRHNQSHNHNTTTQSHQLNTHNKPLSHKSKLITSHNTTNKKKLMKKYNKSNKTKSSSHSTPIKKFHKQKTKKKR